MNAQSVVAALVAEARTAVAAGDHGRTIALPLTWSPNELAAHEIVSRYDSMAQAITIGRAA